MSTAKAPLLAETVRRLVSRGATSNVLNILGKLHPSDVAQLLSELAESYRKPVFELLLQKNLTLAGEALSELGPARGAELLKDMSAQEISRVLQELSPDDSAQFIAELPSELRDEILASMHHEEAAEVEDLLGYADQTAGRIMNPEVFSLQESVTVGEAIARLQASREVEMVFYIYVVDEGNNLVGVLSLRQLLLHKPETLLKNIMTTDVIRVAVETDQEEVAQLVASYNLLAIPVVEQGKLVGVITVDDVIDVIKEEATEDIYRLAGLDVSERVFTSPRRSTRMRLPWLAVNLATAFLAASVVSIFEGTIRSYALLAVFMPIVAGMGGNAATQTLTVMVRGIALGELTWANSRKALFKEALVGLANGVALGAVVSVVVMLWKGNPILGVILGLAMLGNMVVATVAGTLVPLALRWMKVDPALASSVFVTTCTDVFGFFSFLGLGTIFLRHLV